MSEIVKVRFAKGWLSRMIEDARVALLARDMARENPQAVLDAAAGITRLEAEVSRLTSLAQEGENRGLEKAAKVAGNYIQSNDTRDVRSDSLKEYLKGAAEASQKIAAAIRALSQGPGEGK